MAIKGKELEKFKNQLLEMRKQLTISIQGTKEAVKE